MYMEPRKTISAIMRLKRLTEQGGIKDLQLVDIIFLLFLADGEAHLRSDIQEEFFKLKLNNSLSDESAKRLKSRWQLIEKVRMNDSDDRVIGYSLNIRGQQLVNDFLRDLGDAYDNSGKRR